MGPGMILGPFPSCHSFSSTHFPVFIFMYSFPFSSSQIPIVLYAPSEITIESAFVGWIIKFQIMLLFFAKICYLEACPKLERLWFQRGLLTIQKIRDPIDRKFWHWSTWSTAICIIIILLPGIMTTLVRVNFRVKGQLFYRSSCCTFAVFKIL